ncbi:MAG: transporter substrate-binding domain-containing protein, partial [Clostridia bacterium]|nr:transporter substrate-binding domain-containing protein [Clostridia bacterium]
MAVMFTSLCPSAVMAEESDEKVVRVGYVNAENYEEGGEGEYKSGFGYEYFQKISSITGWEYEYVHGSFAECYQMLVDGEIDLFGNVSYKPERAELMFFSDYPEGKDTYWLYAGNHRDDLLTKDTSKLSGCRIGVTRGSYQESLLVNYLMEKNIDCEIVCCDGFNEMMTKLDEEELDAIAAPDLSTEYGYKIITMLGTSDYYFAVSKLRPDILEELNEALYEIQTAEPEYNSLLVNRYNYKMASGLIMNEEEEKWIENHDRTIRMGCYEDYLPFIGERDGQYIGVITEVIKTLKKEYNIDVELTAYADFDEMKAALRAGEVDLIGPVIGDFYLAEQDKFVLSEAIVETTPVVFYKDNNMENPNTVIAATYKSVFNPDVVSVIFPDAEIMICESTDECLEAVDKGTARATVIPASRINIVRRNPLTEKMYVAEVSNRLGIQLLATKSNRRAATIVNKAILHSSVGLNGMVMAENADSGKSATVLDVIKRYTVPILAVVGTILLVLLYLSVLLLLNRKKLQKALESSKITNEKLENQQKELEVLAAEAQAANKAKTDFLFNMSHDIRTPMNAIIGFTELLRRHIDDKEAALQYIQKIENSNDFLLSLINNVLEMARIESGKESLEEVICNAEDFIHSLYSVFEGQIRDKNIHFTGKIDVTHKEFWADDTKVGEVLLNIMSNAVKYTPEGGAISFSVRELPSERQGFAILETVIEDTGIGMSAEFLPHLFDEFTREKNSTASGVIGTGLGMSIVKKLTALMDGDISVESELGVGTKFTLLIPHRIADSSQTRVDSYDFTNEIRKYDQRLFEGRRLLMAEDNELNAEISMSI